MGYTRDMFKGSIQIIAKKDKKGKLFCELDIAKVGGYIAEKPAEYAELLSTIPEAMKHYKVNLSGYSLYLRDEADWKHFGVKHERSGDYYVPIDGYTVAQVTKIFAEREITCEAKKFGKPKLYANSKTPVKRTQKADSKVIRFGK